MVGELLAQLPFNVYEASTVLDMFGYDLEILSGILVIVSNVSYLLLVQQRLATSCILLEPR